MTDRLKCEDCGGLFYHLDGNRWCEECFDKGLIQDMADHFKCTVEQEMRELALPPVTPNHS